MLRPMRTVQRPAHWIGREWYLRPSMRVRASVVALFIALAPSAAVAQQRLGAAELTRVKSLLEVHRAELSAEQYALLSTRLAQTQQAYAELVVLTEAGGEAAAVGAAAEATAATGRAVLGGIAEVLPLLVFFWPATAHAPGMKEERPAVRAARTKLESSVKELAHAAQQVEAEKKTASPKPEKAPDSKKNCYCICGDPKDPITKRKAIGHMLEFQCRANCMLEHHFEQGKYTCL
jgi:hypothetical protein